MVLVVVLMVDDGHNDGGSYGGGGDFGNGGGGGCPEPKKNDKGTYINMTMNRLQQLPWRPAVQWW